MKGITFTRAKLKELKLAYNWALAQGHQQFEFEGQQILVSYAKYLIQYLELKFKPDVRTVQAGDEPQYYTDGEGFEVWSG
jgi:hypothetical protein